MKQLILMIIAALALYSCNNNSGQVNSPPDSAVQVVADTTIPAATAGDPNDPANRTIDSLRAIGKYEDPARKSVKDPLEGIDTTSNLNPPHGQPGHRCDAPVGAEVSTMPKTQGMSLCK